MRAPVAESPYHSRCQNRLVTGRVVGKPEAIQKRASRKLNGNKDPANVVFSSIRGEQFNFLTARQARSRG